MFNMFLIVNKSHEKIKTYNELMLLTSAVCAVYPKTDISYSSVPQSSVVFQKRFKTHQ